MLSTPSYTKIYCEKKNLSYLYNIHTFLSTQDWLNSEEWGFQILSYLAMLTQNTCTSKVFFFLCKQTGSVRKKKPIKWISINIDSTTLRFYNKNWEKINNNNN